MSGFSSENTMTRRTNRTSSPQTEIARVDRGAEGAESSPRLMAPLHGGGPGPARGGRGQRCDGQCVTGDLGRHPAAAEDQRAMADTLDLLEIGRDQQHRQSLARARAAADGKSPPSAPTSTPIVGSSRISSLTCASIQRATDHLLLVAAGQRRDRLFQPCRLDGEAPHRRFGVRRVRVRASTNSRTPLPLAAGFR